MFCVLCTVEFGVQAVQEIAWNDAAFANLVLPAGRKTLLRALVEAHDADVGFDDFVRGKGHGLVVNLFGPPGVGKTLSAEATSEHVRRPLYVVGGGDLGTTAAALDATLQKVFDIATGWKAIVLIDEVRTRRAIVVHSCAPVGADRLRVAGGRLPRATFAPRSGAERDGGCIVSGHDPPPLAGIPCRDGRADVLTCFVWEQACGISSTTAASSF